MALDKVFTYIENINNDIEDNEDLVLDITKQMIKEMIINTTLKNYLGNDLPNEIYVMWNGAVAINITINNNRCVFSVNDYGVAMYSKINGEVQYFNDNYNDEALYTLVDTMIPKLLE